MERPDALNAVKVKLLVEDERTLVVSAISGLGGLGKSVLATALVRDPEVQARFEDGILWVTLGQNPDLQTMLGDWIRELDKSREAFSANTLEAASRYLHNLLAERRMLLVVDDVWNAAHAEWFRVGGAGCRVLVTTREAQIAGAEYYPLDLMSEEEAVDLVRQKLAQQWTAEQEAEMKAFARVLGYLPLALDLATNQVRDGFTWAELRSEFEVERRAVALEVLDASEAWDQLDEEQQRKYSLQACFQLSLRRLKLEQLQQFAWLGVLPEDVNLSAQVAEVLWNVRPLKAKKALIDLRQRSFLTDGVVTFEGELTYRVHDLMHDMACNLIEDGILEIQNLNSKIQNLPLAHQQLLERYRARATNHGWDGLPNDGYIHRHLTWHMEQANWVNEIHALMAMSDTQGRNAWFEACNQIGQPAIFVEDVARGWELAEQRYESDQSQSIALQCRYALIKAALNSLIANLSIAMMAEFVKRNFWTIEQAWAYVEQMQASTRLASAIHALTPYLSKSLFQEVLVAAQGIQDESSRASVLSELAKVDGADCAAVLAAVQRIQSESSRASALNELAKVDGAYFTEVLAEARGIQDESTQASVLSELAKVDGADCAAVLAAAQGIQDESRRAFVLSELAKVDGADHAAVLAAVQGIQDEYDYSQAILKMTCFVPYQSSDVAKALSIVAKTLKVIRNGNSEIIYAYLLQDLAKFIPDFLNEALEFASTLESKLDFALILGELTCSYPHLLSQALHMASTLTNPFERDLALNGLINNLPSSLINQLIETLYFVQGNELRTEILNKIEKVQLFARQTKNDVYQRLQRIETVQDPIKRADHLSELLPHLPLCILPLEHWQNYLHTLASRKRSHLMQDLATLYPAILHLGSEEAMRGVVDAMREVCRQWK